jgi:hypothetical protein
MTFVAQVDEVWVDDDYAPEGVNDGHTWGQDAFNMIQDGIDTVESPGTVHVAPGNYNESITMKSGVKILGAGAGFNPNTHTIIDGSGLWQTVVTATNVDASATLDGLTIANGYGYFYGGGMHNSQSSPRVTNCIFSGNEAEESFGGGGMCNQNSSPTVINCIFSGNLSWTNGGGMSNIQSSPNLIHCTFSGNEANSGNGGGVFNFQSTPTITNSILWGNSVTFQGNEIFNVVNFPVVSYCDILESSGTYPGTGNINADPLFVDPANGNFRIQPDSPCIDAGNNDAVPLEILTDFEGDGRIADGDDIPGTIVDMGADEYVPAGSQCEGDFDADGDVDGSDLATWAKGGTGIRIEEIAADFGNIHCQ